MTILLMVIEIGHYDYLCKVLLHFINGYCIIFFSVTIQELNAQQYKNIHFIPNKFINIHLFSMFLFSIRFIWIRLGSNRSFIICTIIQRNTVLNIIYDNSFILYQYNINFAANPIKALMQYIIEKFKLRNPNWYNLFAVLRRSCISFFYHLNSEKNPL